MLISPFTFAARRPGERGCLETILSVFKIPKLRRLGHPIPLNDVLYPPAGETGKNGSLS